MEAPDAVFELGLNHLGDVTRARHMIDTLRAQGATHITIQAAIDFSTTTRDIATIQKVQPNCLSLEEVVAVIEHGREAGATMGVAILDPNHVETFVKAGATFFKILSSDLSYVPLHRAVARTQLPCYLSTGLATVEDIKSAIAFIREEAPSADVRLIHTVLQIPTPVAMLNLNNITSLKQTFKVPVAYGQHSDVHEALPVAVAQGAETVFVYVADERSPLLPDGPHAILCSDAGALLQELSQVRVMMGSLERTLTPEEQTKRISLRRSIVAATPIASGEIITAGKIAYKRPGTGLPPADSSKVIGTVAKKDYKQDEDI